MEAFFLATIIVTKDSTFRNRWTLTKSMHCELVLKQVKNVIQREFYLYNIWRFTLNALNYQAVGLKSFLIIS